MTPLGLLMTSLMFPLLLRTLRPSSHSHMSKGKAGDGCIYLNDSGAKVKLGSNGRSYPVGVDGVRLLPSNRPEGWDRESWNCINRIHQNK